MGKGVTSPVSASTAPLPGEEDDEDDDEEEDTSVSISLHLPAAAAAGQPPHLQNRGSASGSSGAASPSANEARMRPKQEQQQQQQQQHPVLSPSAAAAKPAMQIHVRLYFLFQMFSIAFFFLRNSLDKVFIYTEMSVLSQDSSCPSCGLLFGPGRRRKLIDGACGHARCYECTFACDACPVCSDIGAGNAYEEIGRNGRCGPDSP